MNAAILPTAVERLDLENTEDRAQIYLHRQRYDFALERISRMDSTLEIGTGTGYFSEILSRHCKYTGLELDPESCQRARDRVELPSAVVEGDAQNQPFPDSTFTRIVALEVLEHVPDFRKAVREIHRCLTRDGSVIISVPYRRKGGTNPQNPFHVYEPGETEIVQAFQKYFRKVEVLYQHFPETPLMTAARVFRCRRLLGYEKLYSALWRAAPEVINTVRIDSVGKGMRLTLVLVISGRKDSEAL